MKLIYKPFILLTFFCLASCQDKHKIENQYLTIGKLKDYYDITDPKNNDILQLVKFSDFDNKEINGGLQSIFSIDNTQDNLLIENDGIMDRTTPEVVLAGRLKSVETMCAEPNSAWKKFKIVNEIKKTTFKGYKAAVAEFEVEEHVTFLKEPIQKRVKRYAVFVDNDLWNIVISPTKKQTFDAEMKEFEKMIKTLDIK